MQLMYADFFHPPRPRRSVALMRRAVVGSCLAFGMAGCDDPNTPPPTPGADSGSGDEVDAGPSSDSTAVAQAEDAALVSVGHEVTRDAHSPTPSDATRADAETHTPATADGSAPLAFDGSVDAADSARVCKLDACNAEGTCIERQVWTECDCDAALLPTCGLPLFRALGPARTSGEWNLGILSGDGRVAAGTHTFDAETFTSVGVTWSAATGLRVLEQHPDGPTIPTAIDEDGSSLLGYVDLPRGEKLDIWWNDGTLQAGSPEAGTIATPNHHVEIPGETVPERTFDVFDATPDGHVAVGRARRSDDQTSLRDKEAAVWIRDVGVRFVRDILEAAGSDVNLWQLWHVNAVSDDGLTLLGLGVGPDVGYRWYLQLPESALE